MKYFLLTMATIFAASFASAAPTTPAPSPTLQGSWKLTGRECTSNSQTKDGFKVGEDMVQITYNADGTFEYHATIVSCAIVAKGTFLLQGNRVTHTLTESQTCKDKAPVAMNETKYFYIASLTDKETVTVTTGDDAEIACPQGDALISRFTR